MTEGLADPELAMAVVDAEVAMDEVAAVGFGRVGSEADAATAVARVEGLRARVDSLALELQREIDDRALYAADGHASAKVLVRHAGRLSCQEASRRAKAVRALRDLPALAAAHRSGRVGVEQVHRVARAWANPRVRSDVIANDALFVELAEALSYQDFDAVLTDWERLADQDGVGDRARKAHEQRSASVVGHYDGSFTLRASCGGLQGAELREIHRHYIDAEFRSDWAEARDRLGDAATVDDLARTDAQRHMDALHQVFRDAAGHRASVPGGSTIETGVVCDQVTFEREADRLAGGQPAPDARTTSHLVGAAHAVRAGTAAPADPSRPGVEVAPDDVVPSEAPPTAREGEGSGNETGPPSTAVVSRPGAEFRCETVDGIPLDPTEVVAQGLIGHVRRIVLGADSVVVDLGRRSRLFTGPAALAARLGNRTCYWPGCLVPASQCQVDHLEPWASPNQPSTNPGNGGPACGKHNRFKEGGFTVWRDPAGGWHTYRPDGTEI